MKVKSLTFASIIAAIAASLCFGHTIGSARSVGEVNKAVKELLRESETMEYRR